ncbi:MAG: hypothetical protein WKF90_12145 [Pyrinomonadaceae bacterium]
MLSGKSWRTVIATVRHIRFGSGVKWFKLKYEWLAPTDYEDGQRLRYSVKQALNEFGKSLRINFSDFNHSLN